MSESLPSESLADGASTLTGCRSCGHVRGMNHPLAWSLRVTVTAGLLAGCSGPGTPGSRPGSDAASPPESGSGSGAGVGDPCIPSAEYDPTFQAFSIGDVSVEAKDSACASGVCVVNHFQGRVTCPYGQTAPGVGPAGPSGSPAAEEASQDGCVIPGTTPGAPGSQVTATNASVAIPAGKSLGWVPGQITGAGAADRTANKTVYCSCRCENAEGNTNDGATYCTCPGGYTCTQFVSYLGAGSQSTAGGYCLLDGTTYSPAANIADVCAASAATPGTPGYCPIQH